MMLRTARYLFCDSELEDFINAAIPGDEEDGWDDL